MKPGWKTTEFWLTIAMGIWTAVEPTMPPMGKAVVGAAIAAAYAISRGLAKKSP